jgi:hypothetical protein
MGVARIVALFGLPSTINAERGKATVAGSGESHVYKDKPVESAHLSSIDVSGVMKSAEHSKVCFPVGLHTFPDSAAIY